MAKTVLIDEETRYKLGVLNDGNENLGDTVGRLVDEEIERIGLKIPKH